jgi:kumamolisin
MPTVIIKPVDGAFNNPNIDDGGATIENTIDIQSIGAACPTSNLTIILYIGPNTFSEFANILNAILSNNQYKSNVISISWGAPEIYFDTATLNSINSLLNIANTRNINITVASGDNGSSNGVSGTNNCCDFPSSSPHVTACGGTNLVCPNLTYDNKTIETAWTKGGGAISQYFNKPSYQVNIPGTKRSTPDIALNSDPNTGVSFMINDKFYIIGGTSIAAPFFAGYLAAINIKRLINPIIYNLNVNKTCLNDITKGSNGLYKCKIGYDNCTGNGSLIGDKLTNAINFNLKLSTSTVNLKLNETYKIAVPASNLNQFINWSSSNNKIVAVTPNGTLTGKGVGSAIITAHTINFYVKASVKVNVSGTNIRRVVNNSLLLQNCINQKGI